MPQKTIESPIEKKALFPTKVPAGRPFFGNKGPKKIKQRFISTIYAIYATKSEFIENGSAIQVIGFFR